MICKEFENYQLGLTSREKFEVHKLTCTKCAEQQQEDDRLLSLAGTLKQDLAAPDLWDQIENSLKQDMQKPQPYSLRTAPLLAAAVLMLAAAVAVFYWVSVEKNQSGLLEFAALNKVEQSENQYIDAIAQLEEQALPKLKKMNMELALLYKDRLATIDNQIQRCRDALKKNPANTHIRRYMLAALQDKKETLSQLTVM